MSPVEACREWRVVLSGEHGLDDDYDVTLRSLAGVHRHLTKCFAALAPDERLTFCVIGDAGHGPVWVASMERDIWEAVAENPYALRSVRRHGRGLILSAMSLQTR